ncbi:MAG TPA: glycosyltransferase [Acetobacteraceae bacterium]|jgi:dolichol-phosphate mannosyltransferase|nr:glycosyltransferase [Acetobacteraceae bacterium]
MLEARGVVAAEPAVAPAPELSVVVPCYNERANVAPLVAALEAALAGIAWEVIFVDDSSPDGTASEVQRLAASDGRVRCIRRIGRRGLSSAVIEGALASSARYVAVMDGDLQHDETRLPAMLAVLRAGKADLVVGSRHAAGGDAAGLGSSWRHRVSGLGIGLARLFLPVRLADPLSGFFALPRPLFERLAPRLTGAGFKILLDLVLTAGKGLRVVEVPFVFRPRREGESKLDVLVAIQFAALLLDKLTGGLLPLRFAAFACVGAIGVLVNLAVLGVLTKLAGLGFELAQSLATLVAMLANFELNNRVTYRDQRLRGRLLWQGRLLFVLVCGIGAVANVGIAGMLYRRHAGWSLAGAAGAAIGVVWNYAVSATLVWRAR